MTISKHVIRVGRPGAGLIAPTTRTVRLPSRTGPYAPTRRRPWGGRRVQYWAHLPSDPDAVLSTTERVGSRRPGPSGLEHRFVGPGAQPPARGRATVRLMLWSRDPPSVADPGEGVGPPKRALGFYHWTQLRAQCCGTWAIDVVFRWDPATTTGRLEVEGSAGRGPRRSCAGTGGGPNRPYGCSWCGPGSSQGPRRGRGRKGWDKDIRRRTTRPCRGVAASTGCSMVGLAMNPEPTFEVGGTRPHPRQRARPRYQTATSEGTPGAAGDGTHLVSRRFAGPRGPGRSGVGYGPEKTPIWSDLRQMMDPTFTVHTGVRWKTEERGIINNCSAINDSYNSDLGSLIFALDFLQQQEAA